MDYYCCATVHHQTTTRLQVLDFVSMRHIEPMPTQVNQTEQQQGDRGTETTQAAVADHFLVQSVLKPPATKVAS